MWNRHRPSWCVSGKLKRLFGLRIIADCFLITVCWLYPINCRTCKPHPIAGWSITVHVNGLKVGELHEQIQLEYDTEFVDWFYVGKQTAAIRGAKMRGNEC
jgi:hypothetical protein